MLGSSAPELGGPRYLLGFEELRGPFVDEGGLFVDLRRPQGRDADAEQFGGVDGLRWLHGAEVPSRRVLTRPWVVLSDEMLGSGISRPFLVTLRARPRI